MLGNIIVYQRKKKELSQDYICNGICTRKKFSKIEKNNCVDIDRFIVKQLINKLGYKSYNSNNFRRLVILLDDFYIYILEGKIELASNLLSELSSKLIKFNIYDQTLQDLINIFEFCYIKNNKLNKIDIKNLINLKLCFSNSVKELINNLVTRYYLGDTNIDQDNMIEKLNLFEIDGPFTVLNKIHVLNQKKYYADGLLLIENTFLDNKYSEFVNFRYELLQYKFLFYYSIQNNNYSNIQNQINEFELANSERIEHKRKLQMHYQLAVILFMNGELENSEKEYLYVIRNSLSISLNSIVCYNYCVLKKGDLNSFIIPEFDKLKYIYRTVLVNEYLQYKYMLLINKKTNINSKLKQYIEDKFFKDTYASSPVLKIICYEIEGILKEKKDYRFRRKALAKGYIK